MPDTGIDYLSPMELGRMEHSRWGHSVTEEELIDLAHVRVVIDQRQCDEAKTAATQVRSKTKE